MHTPYINKPASRRFSQLSCASSILITMLALLFSPTLQSNNTPRWQETDYLIASFHEIAFRNEYDDESVPVLRRWIQPIRWQLIEDGTQTNKVIKRMLEVQMDHLQHITQHPMYFVGENSTLDNGRLSNLNVIFTRLNQVAKWVHEFNPNQKVNDKIVRESVCLVIFRYESTGEITEGNIIIPIDYASSLGKVPACIVEEITQLMGLPNDSDRVYPSIFNDHSIDDYLSGLDYILLKLLYSPSLKAGDSWGSVRKKLPQIIEESQDMIRRSQYLVLENSLRQWLKNSGY